MDNLQKLEQLKRRAALLCEAAVAQRRTITVRIAKNGILTGTIIAAEYAGIRTTARSMIVKFKVTLACGPNKTERVVYVERI